MNNCKNCNTELDGNFCSNCGHPAKLKRIDWHYIKHEIGQVLQLEKGVLFTIIELLIKPGKSIREFLSENRNRLVKPLLFIILTSLIYTLIENFFHIEDTYVGYEGSEGKAIAKIFQWIQANYGYANIIIGLFIALWIKIFFRKYNYNFYELLILLCFVIGFNMLIFSLFATIEGLTEIVLMQYASFIGIIYVSYAIGSFFENKFKNYLKAFAAYFLGTLTFGITALATGMLIDYIF